MRFLQWCSHSPLGAHHSCITSYTAKQCRPYPPSPSPPLHVPSPRHTLPSRKTFVISLRVGSLSFQHSQHPVPCLHVVSSQSMFAEWVDPGRSRGVGDRGIRSGWLVFDDLEGQPETDWPCWGSGGLWRQSELKSVTMTLYFRDSLVALGWEGRPASAHPVYTSLSRALRCGLQICCCLWPILKATNEESVILHLANEKPVLRQMIQGDRWLVVEWWRRRRSVDSKACFFYTWYRVWPQSSRETLLGWEHELLRWVWEPGVR